MSLCDSSSGSSFHVSGAVLKRCGPTNFDVTGQGGANNGWAIPLAGDTNAVRLP